MIYLKEFRKLIKLFNISFDDGYRNIYTIGKKVFKNCSNKIYIFINPSFRKRNHNGSLKFTIILKIKILLDLIIEEDFFRDNNQNQKINAYKSFLTYLKI